MRGCVWATLLRCIPPEHHNILMLVTRCGTEIALQNILRLDDEVLAIRGRLAGSQDSGRLYFVPLDNIDYFGFNRMVKDEEYATLFGQFQPPPLAAAAPPLVATVAAPPPEPQVVVPPPPSHHDTPQEQPPVEPSPTPPVETPFKAPLPIKSAILERFRARTSGPANLGGT